MRTTEDDQRILKGHVVANQPQPTGRGAARRSRAGHGWMMIACCIPMLVIAVVLVATGVASPSFLLVAISCTLMMALMMRA